MIKACKIYLQAFYYIIEDRLIIVPLLFFPLLPLSYPGT